MFFQDMSSTQKKSSSKAVKVSYAFYLFTLLGHALYSFFFFSEFNASFWILVSGFVVYAASEFLFRKRTGGVSHE